MAITTLDDTDRGDVVLATATFASAPTTVTFIVKTPDGETSYVSGTDSEVTNPSTGVYVLALPIEVDRNHSIRVVGTGDVQAAALGVVNVQRDGFAT